MYRKNNDGLIGCLLALFFMFFGLAVAFGVLFLLTHLIIWVANGLFNYDLTDKFWYVFGAIAILNMLLGGRICSFKVGK